MKSFLKYLFLISIFCTSTLFAQETDKTVSLVVSSQGNTQEEAKQNALRSAIEQAFGTFISSKTEVINDNLIKNEIVSVSNGYIQKYEDISSLKLSNGTYAVTIKAFVSLSKLSNFSSNKGFLIDFSGENFALNLKNIEMNKNNEMKILNNLNLIFDKELSNVFSFKISTNTPKFISDDNYQIQIHTQAIPNENFENVFKFIVKTFNSLSLKSTDLKTLDLFGMKYYKLKFKNIDGKIITSYFRNKSSVDFFYELIDHLETQATNTEITDGYKKYPINLQNNPSTNNYFSAFPFFYNSGAMGDIPIDFSFIKINKVCILDSYINLYYNLDDLKNVKSFIVKNGVMSNRNVTNAKKLGNKIEKINSAKNSLAAFAVIFGIPAIVFLIGTIFK